MQRAKHVVLSLCQRGSGAIEMLVAMAIGLTLSLGLAISLHHSAGLNLRARLLNDRYLTLLRVKALLNKVMQELDRHQLDLLPVIHTNGQVISVDGSPALLPSDRRISPRPGSDALSNVRLDLLATQRVAAVERRGGIYTLTVCPRYARPLNMSVHRDFIGLSNDGFTELLLASDLGDSGNMCRRLRLIETQSLHCPTGVSGSLEAILPILENYTLYVDNDNQLRYLSQRGVEIIGNQPMFSGIRSLRFKLVRASNIVFLESALVLSSGREFSFSLPSLIGRKPHYNYLLNQ